MQYVLLVHSNNGCTNATQGYIERALPALLIRKAIRLLVKLLSLSMVQFLVEEKRCHSPHTSTLCYDL